MLEAGDSLIKLPTFNGPVRLSETLPADNASGAPGIHNVVFEPGVYNAWHEHAGGQILIATDGIGYHQIEGQPVQIMHPGDVVIVLPAYATGTEQLPVAASLTLPSIPIRIRRA